MLLIERERAIVSLVNARGAISVRDLASHCDVTAVTIRRDLKKLEALQLLQRTHGGAARLDAALDRSPIFPAVEINTDALVISPVQSQAAHTLRERALRSHIPLIAESARLDGAVYLGPRNYERSVELGIWTGHYVHDHFESAAHVLLIELQLPNTRERAAGFVDGMRQVLGDHVTFISGDGLGLYKEAYSTAQNALKAHPEINVIFGINDDSVLGGLQAYLDLGRDEARLLAVNVGGEGSTLFNVLQRNGALKACLALFPEVVGRLAVDGIVRLWGGEDLGEAIHTPAALLTTENLQEYYSSGAAGWTLNEAAVDQLEQTRWETSLPVSTGRHISFAIHFRTHEWYQNVAVAMKARADELGVRLSVEDVNEDLRTEITDLRRLIGKLAATYVKDGETVILDAGTPTTSMAHFLDNHRNIHVITNSAAVFQHLQRSPNVRLTLTGGEYHRESGTFLGRGAQLLLRELRADKVFLVASGVSESFGVSCKDAGEADIRRAMIDAAKEVIVLADHTMVGRDSRVRVAGLSAVHTLMTDAGLPSADRFRLNQLGIKVVVAGEVVPN